MEPSDGLVRYAIKVATYVAGSTNLDRDTVESIACEHAVRVARRVESEEESFKLLATVLRFQLVAEAVDELRVFGPSSNTQAQARRRRQKSQFSKKREVSDVLPNVSRTKPFNMVDFLDQFNGDEQLKQLVLLMLADYTQKDLIQRFGYTRAQLTHLRERLGNVLQKQ